MSDPKQRGNHGRVVVLGYLVRGPIGGMTWHYLNYIVGLHRLGMDVMFAEDSDDYESCYDPERHVVTADPHYGLAYAQAVFDRVGLPQRWAYFDAHTAAWLGPSGEAALEFARSADLLISVSGINPVRDWMRGIPVRVLIDTDPAFTQVKHLQDPHARRQAQTFTHFFSFGENITRPDCGIPDDGLPWQPTRQPIVLDLWRDVAPPSAPASFTTIMQWDSYKELRHDGQTYGMKSRSFTPYFDLPLHTDAPLEIALGSPDAPRPQLIENGWRITDPLRISRDPWTYQHYIGQSAGEFAVAKEGYVNTKSGWFSERSACYLAAGRPVVLQDTGFTNHLPAGRGLFAFSSPEQAAEALARCGGDLPAESKAARELAYDYFDSSLVLNRLIDAL
jgi:hypothetical protein